MIMQQRVDALGSKVLLTLIVDTSEKGESILRLIRNFLENFEQMFTRFDISSELSRVNTSAGRETKVSPQFMVLARRAAAYMKGTQGLYNPLLLADVQRAGYMSSMAPYKQPNRPMLDVRDKVTDENKIIFTASSITIPKDSAMDFGGIGKGYALDLLADIVESGGCDDYWLSLGGDIIASGAQENGDPWRIELTDIRISEAEKYVEVQGKRRAIATSSIKKRKGDGWHHIIDPRTKKPAITNVESATVIADSGADADVIAKCLIIAGEDAQTFWSTHRMISAYIQYADSYKKLT